MESKYKKLILGIVLDLIGMIPFIDLIWAPLSAYIMTKMYKGPKGKFGAVLSFVEEFLPFFDFVPSFTLMWFYTYVVRERSTSLA
jgi:hypothetical protein